MTDVPEQNCSCTEVISAIDGLRKDTDQFKTQVLIIHCVMAIVIAILAVCVIALFYWGRKLNRLVNALDPMSKYKKVGPSLYIKSARRDTSSISSSFKHFNANLENPHLDTNHVQSNKDEISKKNNVGTLDRNFFTRSNFTFQNPLSNPDEQDNSLNRRKISDVEAMEAVAKLDKVIY